MRAGLLALISLALLPPAFLLFLATGGLTLPLSAVLSPSGAYREIVLGIRLPTAIASALIGSMLAVSGAVMQLLYRNPLMDPYIAGTSSGAALGAVAAYLAASALGNAYLFFAYQAALAFALALAASALTVTFGRGNIYATVIAGVAISYLFSALTILALSYLARANPQLPPITFWLFGYLTYVDYKYDAVLAAAAAAVVGLAYLEARRIDLVAISDEISSVRGIRPSRYRLAWLIGISLATALVVAKVGVIGFVGFMVPHIARILLKNGSATALVPASAALGALTLTLSAAVSRGALGFEVPVTAITSLIAVPVMVLALSHARRGD